MTDLSDVHAWFDMLWADLSEEEIRPSTGQLAHYTSITTLESILKFNQIWLSNPLFMNDHEELHFGLRIAEQEFMIHEGIRAACGNKESHEILINDFQKKLRQIGSEHAFDTYIACFSLHEAVKDKDGKLSMWRGYGGNGSGVALVFDTTSIKETNTNFLIWAKVHYASREQRTAWIRKKLDLFAELLHRYQLPPSGYRTAIDSLLERFKVFSIFTKHHGFHEEQEWRLVYLRERDKNGMLTDMLGYAIGARGIEPKLKLDLVRLGKIVGQDLSPQRILSRLILGPSISSPLLRATVIRMLETLGLGGLSDKVVTSETPYRNN
jgi:hypothetical protein